MCKDDIRLCLSCASTDENWTPCEEFAEYKKEFGSPKTEPDDSEWVQQHGAISEPKMAIRIMVTKCPSCKKLNKKKKATTELIECVEKVTIPLAGVFSLLMGPEKRVVNMWTKTIYEANPASVATDTETETETESENE